ncbi:hypothetical protein [Mycobacterium sp.]|uniref:hypothetical protein n=1 Tax=Mycobacterium sp. TaxID=1785 RepID=UPI003BAE3FDB
MRGLIAHTCLAATVRFGAELGYEVTVVKRCDGQLSRRRDARGVADQHPRLRDGNTSAEETLEAISTSTA